MPDFDDYKGSFKPAPRFEDFSNHGELVAGS